MLLTCWLWGLSDERMVAAQSGSGFRVDDEEQPKAVMTLVDAAGQEIVDEIDPGKMIVVTTEKSVHDDVDGSMRWRIEGTAQYHIYPNKQSVVIVSDLTAGQIRIQLIAAKGGRSDDQVVILKCGRGPQPPPVVVDPPAPKPVDPVVPVVTEFPPAEVSRLRVLIVYEAQAKMSDEQLLVMNSTKVVAALNEKCFREPSGVAAWRKWDRSSIERTGLKNESAEWQKVWATAVPKLTTLPALVVSCDQGQWTIPFPETEDKAVTLLRGLNVKK